MSILNKIKDYYFLILIIFFFSIIISSNIQKPFIGHHDFNGAFFASIARNLIRYSPSDTKLGLILGSGPISVLDASRYTHNVPLHTWILSLVFLLFGVGHTQARIVSAVFSVGALIFIYLITQKLFSKSIANIASLFFATSAMFLYFSTSVFPDIQGIFLSLAGFYYFLAYLKSNKNIEYLLLLSFSILSLLTIWGSFFLPPFLGFCLLFTEKKQKRKAVVLISLPIMIFLLFLVYVFIISKSFTGGDLIGAALFRLNLGSQSKMFSFTLTQFVKQEITLLNAYYSKLTIVLVITWLFLNMYLLINKKATREKSLVLILFLWGISYPLIFRNAAFIHDYFLIYLAPFIAISSASLIGEIFGILKNSSGFKYFYLFMFLVPFFQLLLVGKFTQALFKTSANREGYILGNVLNKNTKFEDKILILSGQFGAHFGVFTDFYSDRHIDYSDYSIEKLQKVISNYQYIVYIEGRDTGKEVDDYLLSHYPAISNASFKIYRIDEAN